MNYFEMICNLSAIEVEFVLLIEKDYQYQHGNHTMKAFVVSILFFTILTKNSL